ncbi:hypothetical protein ABE237_27890 [Brevibacillus formosus]|uniref:hypothetical protein n=1 Tax=Brevibacillus TaxID=55080 RepID=UPI000D0F7B78|nr:MULTISPECIES: hypothetical protein [Brevibacillus]MBG9942856.1 hypothetical protein [Brevibacillus formosus]MED1945686.1 hypothetical protein [Brevibacillus formosus]MED2000681.1 hypothetical protein [Brevibacillus formosus]MED2084473.1 hypothetical protein [Brevibacillus formosus]PSK15652.1 hypothetical protein C7R94_19635 [Brevibacillus sp. NRRL NRS-603]
MSFSVSQSGLSSKNIQEMYTAKNAAVAQPKETVTQGLKNNATDADTVQISSEAQQLLAARSSKREPGTLKIGDNLITWTMEKGVIHLDNDKDLRNAIRDDINNAEKIADQIRSDYREEYNKRLDISSDSLTWEIIGHIYPGQLARALKKVDFLIPDVISEGLDEVIERTKKIDMGESGKDGNRIVWDAIADLPNWVQDTVKKALD